MELRQYVTLLRKWMRLIIACTAIAGVTAYGISRQQTPIYQATATVLINQARSPVRGTEYADILTSERVARTYAELLQDWPTLEKATNQLGFDGDFRSLQKQYQIEITVNPIRDTQLVDLQVQANSPEVAARLANVMPEVFKSLNQERQRERYEVTRQELQAELQAVERDMMATQEAISGLANAQTPEEKAELSQLQSALKRYEAAYGSLLNNLAELRLSEAQTLDNIVLATPALTPVNPVRPRPLFNALLAAIVGGMLALGAAFLIEYLDDTIKSPDDVRAVTNLPTLAAVIALDGDSPQKRLVAVTAPRSPAAEAYRVLRTNLQFSSLDKPLHSLMVTSPGPGEGKSTTIANLAMVLAQAGNRVLLLDADLRRPNLHKLFQLPNSIGLTNALLQHGDHLDDFIQDAGHNNLFVLTTGPIPPNPAELLGSERMREMLHILQERYDVLLIDSPPVLAVADAAILSNQVDGLILVASAGETRFDMLIRAIERLESVGTRPLGIVLNKLTERKSGQYYYYYYYYASRYNEGDEQDGPSDKGSGAGRLRRARAPKATSQAT